MIICIKCKKEMICDTIGINARWDGTHAYAGDKYVCTCGNTILWCNTKPHHNTRLKKEDIYMDGEYHDYIKPKTIRDCE